MGASATQDEDIIIFNDESESENLEIVNGQEEEKQEASESKSKAAKIKMVETDDLISFGTEEEVTEIKEKGIQNENTQNNVEDSLTSLVSDKAEETQVESPSIEEQLKDLEATAEDATEINLEESLENTSTKDIAIEATSDDTHSEAENQEEISLDLEAEISEDTSSEEFKNQLIEAQDQKDGVSFADMGIDLEKLGDSEGENLKNIEVETETSSENPLEAETGVFGGVALLGLDDQKEENEGKEETNETEMLDLSDDIGAFGDLSGDMEEVDERTHNGILEAAILKLVTREKTIDEDIEKKNEKKSGKKDEIAELRKQIKAFEKEVSEIDKEIAELNTEKKTINKTKDGIEKMKIEESKKAA